MSKMGPKWIAVLAPHCVRSLRSIKVTVQLETEGNCQNKIVSHVDRSDTKFKNSDNFFDIAYIEQDFETKKFLQKWA